MTNDTAPSHRSYHFADSEWNFPLLELHCAGHVARLPPHTWRNFAYLTLYVSDHGSKPTTRVVAMQLESSFLPFVLFLLHRRAVPPASSPTALYTAALQLRELVLMFGVRPGSMMETLAEMMIHEYLSEYVSHDQAWSLIKLGYPNTIDDSRLGIGATVVRCALLRDILYTALLPLHVEVIDIMNSDVLAKLHQKYQDDVNNRNNEKLSPREAQMCSQLRVLLDQRTYASMQIGTTTSLFGP